MKSIVVLVQRLGPQRLAAMAAVTLSLIGFFAFVTMRMSQPRMTTLFAELSASESAAVVRELETRAIRFELGAEAALIRVPVDQVARLRMDLAAKGMPAGGTVGYEIFDKGDSFTATATVQNVNKLRALEGEIARSIRTIERVQGARVHLSLPERRLFQKDKADARASIVLKVRGELDAGQVRAIRHLVASAVEGLKPGRVSLVDETGRLLADGAGDDTDTAALSADRQAAHEKRLRNEVEQIVASVVGRGRARVQVTVDLDTNRIQQTSESFDPESRVVRSTQTRTEQNVSNEGRDNQVSVANELPSSQRRNDQAPTTKEQGQKNEEVINYEISRTTRTETNDAGRIRRLSVAVLVDGAYTRGANGDVTYAARSDEDLQRIATLVRLGVGFDKARGDQIEVVNLRFADQPTVDLPAEPGGLGRLLTFTHEDVLRLSEAGVFLLMTVIVLFFVVRPLLRQVMAPMLDMVIEPPPTLAAPGTTPALTQGSASTAPPQIEHLGPLIAARPVDAAAVLKTWMRQS